MNLQELREQLSIINDESPNIGITIHIVKKDDFSVFNADISDELANEIKETFINSIKEKILDNEELNFRNISSAYETTNSVFLYDIEEFPEKLNVLRNFNPFQGYPTFSFSSDNNMSSIQAMIITFGNEDNYFSIYKHIYPVAILRERTMLRFIPIGNRFEKLNSDVLQINTSIDFLFTDQLLIVNNLSTLMKAYGYDEIIKNQARQRIELISNLNLIDNIDELTEFINNTKYAKKVLRIQPESPVLQLAKSKIITFIKNHPKLSRQIRFNEVEDKIRLDTKTSKEKVIGILNDDFLKSNLTDLDYESENKSTMIEEEN
ncbi:anti-phage protein KwaB [Capnocytophaga cynodegmi]|uniref:anti-phage protein KwaB n=1 Tax=Capnocytophaga cynodegmi TaxID=28189 RepID=UPI00385C18F2